MRRPHLTDPESLALSRLIAERRGWSLTKIAHVFAARTGRTICPSTVHRARKAGVHSTLPHRLPAGQLEALRLLIREANGESSLNEIVAQFAALTGRTLDRSTVHYRIVKERLPRTAAPPGRRAAVPLEAAAARKRATAGGKRAVAGARP